VKGWKQKSSKKDSAKPEEPLSIEETQKYYDLDEFNENIVAKLEDAGEQDDATSSDVGKSKNPDKQEDGLVNENGPEEVDDDDDWETVSDSDTDGELKMSESEQETPQKNKINERVEKGKTQNAEEQTIPLNGKHIKLAIITFLCFLL